jgi:Calx-beta domain
VTIPFRTADGTAASGSDHAAKAGTQTFAPGETTRIITIAVKCDGKRGAN